MRVNMAESTVWWVLAGAVIAVELLSGTFYLLMFAIGLAAAAVAANLGASLSAQVVVAAVVGGGAVIAWRAYKQRRPTAPRASANPDVNLDVGETVHVAAWDADGHASVKYRGANWQVVIAPGNTAVPGACTIVEVLGNRLIVKPT
jgi:membrane protein implicated in regulation of membrane protease activity